MRKVACIWSGTRNALCVLNTVCETRWMQQKRSRIFVRELIQDCERVSGTRISQSHVYSGFMGSDARK